MPTPKHGDEGNLELLTTSIKVREELEHWERLVFSFEMDKGNEQSGTGGINRSQQSQRSRSRSAASNLLPNAGGSGLHDANLLAQLAAASGTGAELDSSLAQLLSSNPYPPAPTAHPGFQNHFFPYGTMGHPQLPPLSSLDFAWNQLAHQQGIHPIYNLPFPTPLGPSVPFPNPQQSTSVAPLVPYQQPDNRERGRDAPVSRPAPTQPRAASIPASSPTSTNSPMEQDDDAEQSVMAEEKRRRNTEASARFRIKKKQRTVNLERSVSDLSGRAEELEKEVSDLRRENGWLKEIVMLKGNRYAAAASAQQRMALSQAVKDAGIDLTAGGAGQASISTTRSSSSGSAMQPEEISSDEESDDKHLKADKKGKGKASASHKGKRK